MEKILNYINGKMQSPAAGHYFDNYEPATGQIYGQIPDSDEADAEAAVRAAEAAFPAWSSCTAEVRSQKLYRLSELIERDAERLARAESRDNGKPLTLARSVDIPRAVSNFRFFATAVLHEQSETHFTENLALNYTLRRPLGTVVCISPWNLPLYLFSWKIAPALAAGNCVVAKPSEITPMTAFLLAELCEEAGIPAGVLNIVHGRGPKIGQALVDHPRIKAVSFTGGTKTGQAIARTLAPKFIKSSLELGGKNPNIVFADADFDKALNVSVRSSFANQGQICLCGSRIFVERSIYEKFREAFVNKVSALKIGDPEEAGIDQGALVSAEHRDKVLAGIRLAEEEGGKILCGGHEVRPAGRCKDGYFIAPTVIEGLAYDCRTNQEEIFGPVVTLSPFDTEEEVLMYANSVRYGLASSVWTSDLNRAQRMSLGIEAGIVWINCWLLRDLRTPFGGMKDSGMGREGGFEALRFFTEEKNVCIKL